MEPVRFIAQDPSVSRYSRRVPQSEWEQHRAFLERLHQQGVTRDQMVRELSSQRGFVVTKNRLDNQMKDWGFTRYKRHSLQLPVVPDIFTHRLPAIEEISETETEFTRPAGGHQHETTNKA